MKHREFQNRETILCDTMETRSQYTLFRKPHDVQYKSELKHNDNFGRRSYVNTASLIKINAMLWCGTCREVILCLCRGTECAADLCTVCSIPLNCSVLSKTDLKFPPGGWAVAQQA